MKLSLKCYFIFNLILDDHPNEALNDTLEILCTLGSGSFGMVYKCRDKLDNSLVALKVIKNKG
jgi:serine/threonine protein kinase